ncbi:MAG: fimbrillin family protein, partial [Alistipes sp.]|nr:fimbrillin family protein [Alistipes sp.]
MKRKLFLMFGMMALLVSCHSDVDELNINNPHSYAIRLDGEITRTDANGFCDGDKIGLYGVNYTNNNATQGTLLDEGNQVDNARYTYNKELGEWQSSGSIYYKDAETNIDLYAYYPYGSPENVNDYIFEVAKDQSGNDAVDGYAASDFLWGKTENITPSEDRVKIRFSHRLSRANVVLTEGSGFGEGEFNTLEKSVLVNSTIRTASIDLATGDAITAGEVEPEGIVMRATDDGWSAIVVPQSVDAGEALLAITIDGIVYRFKRGEAFTYEPGKQHTFTITVNKKSMTGSYEFILTDCEIVDWIADLEAHGGEARQYYVVHLDEAGTLGAKIREAKKNPDKIRNLKVSGKISRTDFDFMSDSMELLQAINLKESEIVGCWYCNVDLYDGRGYHDEYFNGDMPESEKEIEQAVKDRYPNAKISIWDYCQISSAHEIPDCAFTFRSIVHFVFPEKVIRIGYNAFSGTLLSGALIIPEDVVEIGSSAFSGTNISSLQLPAKLERLGDGVFSACKFLAGSLSLPETLVEIGSSCFSGCSMLTGTLTIPSKLKVIRDNCFCGCNFSGDLIIPEGIEKIESAA